MKILEAESGRLTNYEVFRHLTEQKARHMAQGRRGPPNLETVVREVIQYFNTAPNPLAQQPSRYTPESIAELLARLRPYDLAKGEVIMLFNIRPQTIAQLSIILEDMSSRFPQDQQESILEIVTEVLGHYPVPGQPNGDESKDN